MEEEPRWPSDLRPQQQASLNPEEIDDVIIQRTTVIHDRQLPWYGNQWRLSSIFRFNSNEENT